MENILYTFALMVILLVFTAPVGVAIGLACIYGLYISELDSNILVQSFYSLFDSFPLLAIPFFVLAGEIMQRGSMASALLNMFKALGGHLPGGMAVITIMTCLFYAALCGSAVATVAAVGATMIPAMSNEGYPRPFATACSACGGTLGPIIPPSIALILYGSFGNVSVTNLFISAIGPGLLVAGAFIIAALIVVIKNSYGIVHERASIKVRINAIWEAKWALGVPLIVLGGIYGGICTPTEAGATAVIYAIIVESLITRGLSQKKFLESLDGSLHTLGILMLIMVAANALGTLVQFHNLHAVLIDWVHSYISTSWELLLYLLILFTFLGCFMEATALIIILVPILVPIATSYSINPVHFGQFMMITLIAGVITPPIGTNLYVGCTIGNVSFSDLTLACVPFIIAMYIAILLIAFIPAISLFLL